MFEKNKIICIDLDSPDYISGISIKKNDVNFSIKIKETLEKDGVGKFVWFLHVELPKKKNINCLHITQNHRMDILNAKRKLLFF